MKKKKAKRLLSPLLSGVIGGGVALFSVALCCVLCALVFINTKNPADHILTCALIGCFLGAGIGGGVSVYFSNALVSAVYTAVMLLVAAAIISAFLPQADGVLYRVLPPVVMAVAPLAVGRIVIR